MLGMTAGALALAAVSSRAQEVVSPASTRAGVYTVQQAERGRITYAGMCSSCHTGASLTSPIFDKWKGRTVAELFAYTSTQMPKSNPGGLEPGEYADVIAYLLKLNRMPAGTRELAADSTSLAHVVIELPVKPAKSSKRIAPTKSRPKPPVKSPT